MTLSIDELRAALGEARRDARIGAGTHYRHAYQRITQRTADVVDAVLIAGTLSGGARRLGLSTRAVRLHCERLVCARRRRWSHRRVAVGATT